MRKKNIIIYGATGSIGSSVLAILKNNLHKLNLEGITCNKNIKKLIKISNTFNVKKIGFNESEIKDTQVIDYNKYKIFNDISNFHKMITQKTDIIIFANSGLKSIDLLLKVLKSGKKVGIANKECIISLGDRINSFKKKYLTQIIPLDSEHNSIYHLLKINNVDFKSITITASGGPFFKANNYDLKNVTVKQAINHPIWKMGKKISVDSATLMNKALEIIEAKYLFDLKKNEINAIIHPQAIVHAIVNYHNGMSTAILSKPDMKIPISSLFFDFKNFNNANNSLDITKCSKLEFISIDDKKFPAINLAYQVLKKGGSAPHVFNYLNELLVDLFIKNKIKFTEIVKFNEINMEKFFSKNLNISKPNLNDLKNINNWIDNNLYLGN
tara:strand:+ start:2649 stop:3800 length:1152 start_codon:yes stop_codon:yes gene_type:complete